VFSFVCEFALFMMYTRTCECTTMFQLCSGSGSPSRDVSNALQKKCYIPGLAKLCAVSHCLFMQETKEKWNSSEKVIKVNDREV
jgi:hypothetical protein